MNLLTLFCHASYFAVIALGVAFIGALVFRISIKNKKI